MAIKKTCYIIKTHSWACNLRIGGAEGEFGREGRCSEVKIASHLLQTSRDECHQLREGWPLLWKLVPTAPYHTIA